MQLGMHTYKYSNPNMHETAINEKGAINLKKNKERFMGGYGGKVKGESCDYIITLKNKRKGRIF